MKMITGLHGDDRGTDPLRRRTHRARSGSHTNSAWATCPKSPICTAHLSGLEYLVMVGQLRNLPAKPTAERIDGLLRLFSLHGDRHVPISSYSKGMRQKVLLSAALLHNPDLMLLDEPFSGLDVGTGLMSAQPDSGAGGARQGGPVQLA